MQSVFEIIRFLPAFLIGPVSWVLGSLVYFLAGRRRRIAVENVSRGLGLGKGEAGRLARRAFIHIVRVTLEIPKLFRYYPGIREAFHGVGEENLTKAHKKGKGVLLIVSHLGNWEYGAAWIASLGFPTAMVVRPPGNRAAASYIENLRHQIGIETIDRNQGLLAIVRALKNGSLVLVALDQHASNNDVTVNFFGRPARTVGVVASLALKHGIPLVPAFTWREGAGFRAEVLPEIEVNRSEDPEKDVQETTQRLTTLIEEAIREHPDQWLWMHRRWR